MLCEGCGGQMKGWDPLDAGVLDVCELPNVGARSKLWSS